MIQDRANPPYNIAAVNFAGLKLEVEGDAVNGEYTYISKVKVRFSISYTLEPVVSASMKLWRSILDMKGYLEEAIRKAIAGLGIADVSVKVAGRVAPFF